MTKRGVIMKKHFTKALSVMLAVIMTVSYMPLISAKTESVIEIFDNNGVQITEKQYLTEYRSVTLKALAPTTVEETTTDADGNETTTTKVTGTEIDTSDGKRIEWVSNLPLLANVDENGKVTAYDYSKRAVIQLWIDENIKSLPLVGDSMADAIWKALDSTGTDLDDMNTDAIVAIVTAIAGEALGESLRKALDNMNVEITATLYDAEGKVLGKDTVQFVIEKSTIASVVPTGVHITNKKAVPTTVAVGATVQLYGACTPVRLGQGIKWAVGKNALDSSSKNYATVSSDGLVTFTAPGTATIRVNPESTAYAAFSDTITFTVLDPADLPVTDFEITGGTSVAEGSTLQLAVQNVDPAGAYQGDLTWSSSDPTVAVIDENGLVTGLDGGSGLTEYSRSTTITATMGGVSKTIELKVTRALVNATLSSIEITGDETVGIDSGAQYTATVTPPRLNTSSSLSRQWGIVDPVTNEYLPATADAPATDGVGSIDANGYLTAVGSGVVTIYCTATYGSSTITGTYEIVCGKAITDFEISGTVNIDEGDTSQLSIKVLAPEDYEDSLLQTVKWRVDDDSVASVSSDGLILGRDAGGRNKSRTTTVYATVSGITKTATIKVSRGFFNLSKFTDGQVEGPDYVVRDIPHSFSMKTYPESLSQSATYWALIKDDGSDPWTVSNTYNGSNRNTENTFASVSDDGVVTGKEAGTTTLYGYSRYLLQSHVERTKEINIVEIEPETITLKAPTKLKYLEGDTELDLSGMEVYLTYNKESLAPYYPDWESYTDESMVCKVTDYTISEFNPNILDTQQYIIVSVERAGKSYNAAFAVTIDSKQVDTLTLTNPDKYQYFEGEELDITGLTVTANYLNYESELVTDYQIDYDSFSMENFDVEQQVRVYYEHAGRTAEAFFPIIVYGKPVVSVDVNGVLDEWTSEKVVFNLSSSHAINGATYYWRSDKSDNWFKINGDVHTVSTDRNGYIYFKVINGLGYESDETIGYHIMLDNTKPNFRLVNYTTEPTNTDYDIKIENLVYGVSGISSVTLNGVEIGKCESFTVSENGTYTLVITTTIGFSCERSIEVTNIDKQAPTITDVTITQTPEDAPENHFDGELGNYYSGNLTAVATAEDIGTAGIGYIKYRLVNPDYSPATEWIKLKDTENAVCESNFKGYFEFIAVDRAGNESASFYSDGFVRDGFKPVINTLNAVCGEDGEEYTSGTWADDIIYFTPDASCYSGIYAYYYSIDGGEWQKLTTDTLRAKDDGVFTYRFKAVSYSGLESDISEMAVSIDRTVPVIRVEFDGTFGRWTSDDIKFTLSTLNNCPSGCTYYYNDGKGWHELTSNTLLLNESSNAYYSFKAVNGAGLESAPSDSYKVMIDKVEPSGYIIPGVTAKTDSPYEVAIVPQVGEAGYMKIYFNGEDVTDSLKATVSKNGSYALTIIGNNLLSSTVMIDISNFSAIPSMLFTYENISDEALKVVSYNGTSANVTVPMEANSVEVKEIGENAFLNKTSVTSVNIPNTVETIGDNAFKSAENLEKVTIPESVTSIGETAFDGCEKVTIYGYKNSYAEAYASEHNIPFVLLDLTPVGKTVINEEAGLIFTQESYKSAVEDIVNADSSYTVMAIPTVVGNVNYFGTGSVLYFFRNGRLAYTYTLIVYGDLNGDSTIDVMDLSLAEKVQTGKATLDEYYLLAADFGNDGVIDVTDYQQLLNLLLRQ